MKNIIYLLLLLSFLLALPGSASLVLKNLTINEEPLVNVSIPLVGLFFFNSVKKELISYFPTEKEVPGYLPPTPSDVTLLCRLKGSDSREFVISDDTMDIPKNIASCDAKIKISNVPSDTAVLPWLRIEFMRGVSHFLEAGLLAQATRLFSKVSALEFFGSREFGLQSRDAWARNLPKYVCKMYDNLVESKEHEDTYPIYDWSLFTESELDIASKSCRPNIDKLLSKIVDGIKQKKYNEIAVIWRNVLNFKLLSKSSVAAQKEIFRALFGSYREDLQQLLFSEKYDEAGELWAVIKNLGLFTEQDDKATLESLMPWVSAQVEKASHYLTTGQYENFNNINKIKKAVSFLWDRLAPRIQEQYDRWVKDNLAPVDSFMRERNFGAAQKALINTEAAIKATEDSHFYDYIKINKIKESFVNFPVFPSEIKRRVIKYLYSQIETNLEQNRMTEAARWLKVFTSGEYRGMGLDQQDLRSAYAKFAFRIIPEESSISLKVPGKFLAARIAVHFARKTKDNPNPYVERFNLQIPVGATVRELKEALLGHYRKYPNVYFHQKEPRLENFLIDYEDDKYAPVDWYETINGHLVYESKIYYVAPPSSRKTVDSVLEQIIDLYEAGKIEEAAHRYAEEKSNPVFDRRSRYSIISGFEIIENIFGAKAIEQLTALLHTLEGNTSSATEPIKSKMVKLITQKIELLSKYQIMKSHFDANEEHQAFNVFLTIRDGDFRPADKEKARLHYNDLQAQFTLKPLLEEMATHFKNNALGGAWEIIKTIRQGEYSSEQKQYAERVYKGLASHYQSDLSKKDMKKALDNDDYQAMLRLVLRFQKLEGDQYGEFTKDLQDTMLSLLKTRLKNAGDSTGPWSAFILHSVIDSYMDNDRFSFSIRLKNLYAGAKKTAAEKNLKLDNLSKMLEKMMFGFLIAEMEEDSRNNKIGLAMQKMQEYLTIDVPQEDKEKARAHFAQLVEQMQTIVPK